MRFRLGDLDLDRDEVCDFLELSFFDLLRLLDFDSVFSDNSFEDLGFFSFFLIEDLIEDLLSDSLSFEVDSTALSLTAFEVWVSVDSVIGKVELLLLSIIRGDISSSLTVTLEVDCVGWISTVNDCGFVSEAAFS